jgi:hypothetical protein
MIRLNLPTEPYWLDLPLGVRLHVRPLDTAVYEACRYRAAREAKRRIEERKDSENITSIDEDDADGLATFLVTAALANAAIIAWEGVETTDGSDIAPVTETSVSDLMRIPLIASEFRRRILEPYEHLVSEGNASGPLPDGSLAEAPITAPNAKPKACPAPKANPDATASSVPSSDTSR